jgi:hypothetical protein
MPRKKGDLPLNVEEVERAKSLSALGRSYRAIGRELGRSAHTIKKALTSSAEIVGQVAELKANLADLYESLTLQTLQSIGLDTIKDASLLQRATSAGIFTDKFRLLRGESTTIVGVDVLLSIAGELRRQERIDDYAPTITLPPVPQAERILPAPAAEPIPAPAPIPVQSKAELHPPLTKIRFTPVLPGKHPDHCPPENELVRGLFLRKT